MQLPPRLSAEEETALIASMRAGDRTARNSLILNCMRMSIKVASRFRRAFPDAAERFSIASIGTIRAVDAFNSGYNCALSTCAWGYVLNEFRHELRRMKRDQYRTAARLDEPMTSDGSKTLGHLIEAPDTSEMLRDYQDAVRAIAQLPDDLRQVMILRYIAEELSQSAVAKRLGTSQMTVCRREKMALEQCRKALHG